MDGNHQPHGIALPSAAVGAVDRCCLSTNCRSINFAPELKRVRRSLHRAPYTNQREQHPITRERTRAKIPQQSTCTHKDASTHRHVHVRKAEKAHAHAHACALTHSPHMHTACALTHVHASTDGRTGLLTCDQTHMFDGPHARLSSASSEYLAQCEWYSY